MERKHRLHLAALSLCIITSVCLQTEIAAFALGQLSLQELRLNNPSELIASKTENKQALGRTGCADATGQRNLGTILSDWPGYGDSLLHVLKSTWHIR
jgi:hypothetical protein